MGRNPKIIVMVGGRGTGKTTLTRKIMAGSKSKRILIADTLDHQGWQDVTKIHTLQELKRFRSGTLRLFGPMPKDIVQALRKIKNTLIIFEDSRKFTGSRISNEMEELFIDSKQRGNELLFMYHGFGLVPRAMGDYIDWLICLKTKKPPLKEQSDRFGDIESVIETAERVKAHPNPYHHEVCVLES